LNDEISDFIDHEVNKTKGDDLFDLVKHKYPDAPDEIITWQIMIHEGGDVRIEK
jgi:hypothetical protein